jgi:hypothetical protein
MSDSNTITSAIDQLVALSAEPNNTAAGPAGNLTADLRLNNDGTVEVLRAAEPGHVVAPEGYNATGQVEQLNAEIARIEGELALGTFDAQGNRTGDKFVGREREVRAAQIASLRSSREYTMARGLQIAAQRAADSAAAERATAEQAAAFAFHGGNPAKAELLRNEIEQAEARALAEKIVRGRRG